MRIEVSTMPRRRRNQLRACGLWSISESTSFLNRALLIGGAQRGR